MSKSNTFSSISTTDLNSLEPELGGNELPTRVCIKKAELVKRGYTDFEDWVNRPGHLYIGRTVRFVKGATGTPFQNPYSVKQFGLRKALQLYEKYVTSSESLVYKEDILGILDYTEIGCWCGSDSQCHGDILINLAIKYNK